MFTPCQLRYLIVMLTVYYPGSMPKKYFVFEMNNCSDAITLLGLFFLTYCFLSNCQGLPALSGLLVHCNTTDGQFFYHEASLGSEVILPLNGSVQTHNEALVTKRRSDSSYNCDADDKGDSEIGESSIEGLYFENQDLVDNSAKHGFGNAERHVLISLLFSILF